MRWSTSASGQPAIDVLHVSCRVINPASRRVIHKCGFQYAGQGMMNSIVAGQVPIERYRLDRKTWVSLRSWGLRRTPALPPCGGGLGATAASRFNALCARAIRLTRRDSNIAMKFLDQAKVYIRSGDGGAGASRSGARNSSSSAGRTAAMAAAAATSGWRPSTG